MLEDLARSRWLTPAEAARRAGLTVATLAAYRLHGSGPAFRRVGGRVRYPQDELVAWMAARAAAPRVGRPPRAGRAKGR
jgi:predicted site-specific integrase-resolvase